jgi:hypothetical protein
VLLPNLEKLLNKRRTVLLDEQTPETTVVNFFDGVKRTAIISTYSFKSVKCLKINHVKKNRIS